MSIENEACLRNLFSLNIKRFRIRQGLSQARLAEKIDMSTNYLSDIERGKGWVSPISLLRLANALEVEVFELFKPQELTQADVLQTVNKCLDDFSTALRLSFDKSLSDALRNIRENF